MSGGWAYSENVALRPRNDVADATELVLQTGEFRGIRNGHDHALPGRHDLGDLNTRLANGILEGAIRSDFRYVSPSAERHYIFTHQFTFGPTSRPVRSNLSIEVLRLQYR
jgi:hypothetical protein